MKFRLGSEITAEQREFFAENGYLHFEGVASRAELEGMLADVDRVEAALMAQRRTAVHGIPLFFGRRPDGSRGIQRLAFTSLFSAAVARFVRDPRFEPVRRLVGEGARVGEDEKDGVVVNRFVNLPGSAHRRLGWHTDGLRDLFYLRKPGPMLNVGLHFDDCTAENGGLRLLPGTHKQSFLAMCFAKPYFVWHRADRREVCVETKAGDLTIHDGRLWHRVARSTLTGAASLRRTMYVPYLVGPRQPKTESSRMPLYHRAGALLRKLKTGAALAILALAPARARAAAYWNLDQGAENFARGGAGIVAPSDPTAVYLNPSALVALPGLQLLGAANASDDHRRFERAPDALGAHDASQNRMPITPSPGVFGAWRITPRLAAGVGLYGPPCSDAEYAPGGAERYSIVESHNRQMHRALSFALAIPEARLRVGVTGMLVKQTVDMRQDFNTFLGGPEAPGWDAQAHVVAVDRDIPTAAAGVTFDATDRLQLAASGQLGWRVHARGTIAAALGDQLAQEATVKGDAVTVSFRLPPVARLAARVHDPSDAWDGELALVYEAWSQDHETVLAPSHVYLVTTSGIGLSVPTIRQQTHLRDTFSVRAGGSLRAGSLRLRGGAFYERAAVAPQHLSPATFDLDKIGITAGGRAPLPRRAWLDFALGGQYWIPAHVTASDVMLPDPVHRKTAWAIGNGRYSNWRVTGMLGIGIAI